MRIVVVGGTGHIGTFLVPRLVRAGHDVVVVTRGTSEPYAAAPEWDDVERVVADREAADRAGTFGARVADLRPDAVVDLVCFTPASSQALVEALRGRTGHLVHCGTLWRHGPSRWSPISEDTGTGTEPFGAYGVAKDAIARALAQETASGGLVTTSLHPGHIVGPGWHPVGPLGNLDPAVWRILAHGEVLQIPGSGAEHMHHVHADDVAQGFELALRHRDAVAGHDLHVVAATALNVQGFAEVAAGWWGHEAQLESVGWEQFRATADPEHAEASWDHLSRNHVLSIERARRLLGYEPAHTPQDAVREAVAHLVERGDLPVPHPVG